MTTHALEYPNLNEYDVYKMNLEDISKIIWRPIKVSDIEYAILIKVDEQTKCHLYNDWFHYLTIKWWTVPKNKEYDYQGLYQGSIVIHSCDDASYTAWFSARSYNAFLETWGQILGYITHPDNDLTLGINGLKFLEFCTTHLDCFDTDLN